MFFFTKIWTSYILETPSELFTEAEEIKARRENNAKRAELVGPLVRWRNWETPGEAMWVCLEGYPPTWQLTWFFPHLQIKRRAHETNIASIACFSLEFSTERCTAAGGRSRKYGRRLEIGRRQKQIRPIACTNTVNTWVCLKIVYPIVPNGFADHYTY